MKTKDRKDRKNIVILIGVVVILLFVAFRMGFLGVGGACSDADINQDGVVDLSDQTLLSNDYGKCGAEISHPRADIDGGGCVDYDDLIILSYWYGNTCPTDTTTTTTHATTTTTLCTHDCGGGIPQLYLGIGAAVILGLIVLFIKNKK